MDHNSNKEFKWEQHSLLVVRFVYAILTGIITALLILNWYFFFVIIGGYCLLESIVVFWIVKENKVITSELESERRTLTVNERTPFSPPSSNHYALEYAVVGLYLSFIMITIFGALTEWIIEVVLIFC